MVGEETLRLLLVGIANVSPQSLVMIGVSFVLFYLAIVEGLRAAAAAADRRRLPARQSAAVAADRR